MPGPNILFLFTDQQRWDALGCADGWVRTPNLDGIAAEGVTFSQCVTNSPVCVPARISLVTGWYPHNTGVWTNRPVLLPADAPNWVRQLREAGYRTSLFGKSHLYPYSQYGDLREGEHLLRAYGFDDSDEVPGPRGAAKFSCRMTDEWKRHGLLAAYREDMRERLDAPLPIVSPSPLGFNHHYDVYVGRRAAAYLREYHHPQPWFCWVGFPGPHEPWDAPEPYASMYDPESVPDPIPYTPETWRRGPPGARGWLDRKLRESGDRISVRLAKRLRANYGGKVTLIDDMIGEIIEVIRQRGEFERTIIAFSSDHGEMNGDFGLVGKSNMLDGAVRVPLVIRVPGNRFLNRKFDDPVELMDLGPTLVELGGGVLCHRQFGRSLAPVLEDPMLPHRSEALVELRREILLFDRSWKMTVNAGGVPSLLFDRQADPQELRNLAGMPEYGAIERQLLGRLRRRLAETELDLAGASPLG